MSKDTIDITPDPRILQVLGEIPFSYEKCIYELIDNSIDAFQSSDTSSQNEIIITIPKKPKADMNYGDNDKLIIEDNAQGMTRSQLQNALRAGFSGQNSIDKLGLFGIGFNISTARLGSRTEIITATEDSDFAEKVIIDFREIKKNESFTVPIERIKKDKTGTKISISKLNTDTLRSSNQRVPIAGKIGRTYASIIRNKNIKIIYAGEIVKPFVHYAWSKHRMGQAFQKKTPVPARIDIDEVIDKKRYCDPCRVWVDGDEAECPSCESSVNIKYRERKVRGWVGIQCYFDEDDYGIDLIRNGRLIVKSDKSMFKWTNPKTEEDETEYPRDGQSGGRIIGEIELDYCEVPYTKDKFELSNNYINARNVIRGNGPMQPKLAKMRGYPDNLTPVSLLFNAFRYTKAGIPNLVPTNQITRGGVFTNEHILTLKQNFFDGLKGFNDDEAMYKFVEETATGKRSKEDEDKVIDELLGETSTANSNDFTNPEITKEVDETQGRIPDELLSKKYELDIFETKLTVDAYELPNKKIADGVKVLYKGPELDFTYFPDSDIFTETILKPEDLLINEVAHALSNNNSNKLERNPISAIERKIRQKYFPHLMPEYSYAMKEIEDLFKELKYHLSSWFEDIEYIDIDNFDNSEIQQIIDKIMKAENISRERSEIELKSGKIVEYASRKLIVDIIRKNPMSIFDERFFSYKIISDDDPVVRETMSCFDDIIWLDENPPRKNIYWQSKYKKLIGSLNIITSRRVESQS